MVPLEPQNVYTDIRLDDTRTKTTRRARSGLCDCICREPGSAWAYGQATNGTRSGLKSRRRRRLGWLKLNRLRRNSKQRRLITRCQLRYRAGAPPLPSTWLCANEILQAGRVLGSKWRLEFASPCMKSTKYGASFGTPFEYQNLAAAQTASYWPSSYQKA